MRRFTYSILLIAFSLLVCAVPSQWATGAGRDKNTTKPNKAKGRTRTPASRQTVGADVAKARADLKRLARQREAERWEYAVRAYPNGIPEGARTRALDAINEMMSHARVSAAPAPGRLGQARAEAEVIEGINWFPMGPAPINGFFDASSGRASAIAVNPVNPDDIWLGAAGGGVWHSTNGGGKWVSPSDKKASLAIGTIALDPSGCTLTARAPRST